ncbi:MAG: FecR family protein [Gammaproteobacteria bacterium]|nr:FecR family protein [Gammaproteobacteria bacterium]MDH3362231.1 FecR family protein [Gammaproteobacteria bacterium]MDH3480263.1 FecR family protein [Gammaproteobacteria bacterium]
MTKHTNHDKELERDEEAMARLLRLAGPRAEIPADAESRVYARVLKEWQVSTEAPEDARVYKLVHRTWKRDAALAATKRWVMPIALAAAAALVAIFISQPQPNRPVVVGTVAKVIAPAASDSSFAVGDEIYAGMTIETGDGQGMSFLLARNESLRLDENSAIRVEAGDQFRLLRGRVYADTGEFVYRDGGLRIDSVFGAVTDIGTQFAVSIRDDLLDVAVREGRVDVRKEAHKYVAMSGERIRLLEKGEVEVDPLALTDEYWNWTTELAPAFEIEGRSLMDFLKWTARESGRILYFEDTELRMAAMRTDLHGSISDFSPMEAIESVLATTAFRYRVEADRIIIER